MKDLFTKNWQSWSILQYSQARKLSLFKPKAEPKSDCEEEVRRSFEELVLHGIKLLYVFGVGMGTLYNYAKKWLKEDEGRYLIFFEDDKETIYHLLHTSLGEEIVNDSQVRLFLMDDVNISVYVQPFVLKSYAFLAHPDYAKRRKEVYQQWKAKISFNINMIGPAIMEYSDHGLSFFTNYFRNLLCLPESALGPKMFDQFKGMPAIICGAGPSLAKNLEVLTQLRDKSLIFAGGTAMNALNAAGFIPHFGVGIDPNKAQFTRLIMNQAFSVPYFYRNRILHEALESIHGKHLYITGSGGYAISSWFEEQLGIKQPMDIEEGCNVINFSLAIAHALGCNPIIFVGLDLAYTGEKSYPPGILNHPLHNRKEYFGTKSTMEDVIASLDIFGKPVFTLWKWLAESYWFGDFAKLCPNKNFINATEGGIGFPGIPNFQLKEIADNLLTRVYDFDGMIHEKILKAHMPKTANKRAVQEKMSHLQRSLEQSERLCRTLQKDCELTRSNHRNGIEGPPLSEEGLKALRQLEEEPAFDNLLLAFSDHFLDYHQLEYDNLKLQADRLKAAAIEMKKAELNAARFAFLRETAKVNKNLVEAVLKEDADRQLQFLMRTAAPVEEKILLDDQELGIPIEEPFSQEPILQYHPNGKVSVEQFFWEGTLHGPSTFFNEEGRVISRHWFVKGVRQGKALTYTEEGKIASVKRYRDGLWDGLQQFFYPNGTLNAQLPYHKGVLHGDVWLYYPSGHLKRQLHFTEGKRNGIEKIWNELGLLKIEAGFKNDEPFGTARQWYDNGNMALEITYEDDPRNFILKEWDESGFPKVTERRVTGDYFEQVAQQTDKLTNTLCEVLSQVNSLAPLVDQIVGNKSEMPLQSIQKELENLKRISHELIEESGFQSTHEEELFWKGPTARREVEVQVKEMAAEMSKQINKMQSSLVTSLGLLAKKLKEKRKSE